MIIPVGTKVEITEGDTIRKKGSIGYASSFLPVFGNPSIDALQLVVFTRLGKRGKSRLMVMPVACRVLNYEDVISVKDLELFNEIAVRTTIKAPPRKKSTKYNPSLKTEVKPVKDDKVPMNLAEWHWLDFFAHAIAELLFLSTTNSYYQSAISIGPYRMSNDARMILENLKLAGRNIPHPAARGGLMDIIKGGDTMRAARTLMKAIDGDNEYNLDYMGAEFRDVGSRRRIMDYLKRLYAINTPALKFYDAYLPYYQTIAADFIGFALERYNKSNKTKNTPKKMNPNESNNPNSELFTVFAIDVENSVQNHGRRNCKYVNMLPEEVKMPEALSNDPRVRHRLFGRERHPERARERRVYARPVDAPLAVNFDPEPEAGDPQGDPHGDPQEGRGRPQWRPQWGPEDRPGGPGVCRDDPEPVENMPVDQEEF